MLVGSSMGGWIMLLAALARPTRIAGLVGIAAAPNFTERLMWARFDNTTNSALQRNGSIEERLAYDSEPTIITYRLIEEGRHHPLLERPIALACPVRLIHGMHDPDVPWQMALGLASWLTSNDVRLHFIKDGDHRLSRESDIAFITGVVGDLLLGVRDGSRPDDGR